MEPGDLRLQPGIGMMLYFATLVGLRAKMLDRASIADVRRRSIPNQTPHIVGSDRLELLSSRTLPNIVMAMVSEACDAHLLGPMMGMTCDQLETEGHKEKKHRIGAGEQHFCIDGLWH